MTGLDGALVELDEEEETLGDVEDEGFFSDIFFVCHLVSASQQRERMWLSFTGLEGGMKLTSECSLGRLKRGNFNQTCAGLYKRVHVGKYFIDNR